MAIAMSVRDARGNWKFEQTNGYTVQMKGIQQSTVNHDAVRASLSGSATTAGLDGAVSGFVTDNTIFFNVDWDRSNPGRGGEYHGTFQTVSSDGGAAAAGTTFDLDHAGVSAQWRSFGHQFNLT
ncbi:hypothetical protein ACFYNM_39520 [Streptomyces spororaveus]|uniref:hypothetical protein n=1 Tax=Streptomyces spororaveus TaxID=284039 RepID=UPI003673FC5F